MERLLFFKSSRWSYTTNQSNLLSYLSWSAKQLNCSRQLVDGSTAWYHLNLSVGSLRLRPHKKYNQCAFLIKKCLQEVLDSVIWWQCSLAWWMCSVCVNQLINARYMTLYNIHVNKAIELHVWALEWLAHILNTLQKLGGKSRTHPRL